MKGFDVFCVVSMSKKLKKGVLLLVIWDAITLMWYPQCQKLDKILKGPAYKLLLSLQLFQMFTGPLF